MCVCAYVCLRMCANDACIHVECGLKPCAFDEMNMTLQTMEGSRSICTPKCQTSDDCHAALDHSCSEMANVNPLCSVVGRDGQRFCGLFCHPDPENNIIESRHTSQQTVDQGPGDSCDNSGKAQCNIMAGTNRLMCLFST